MKEFLFRHLNKNELMVSVFNDAKTRVEFHYLGGQPRAFFSELKPLIAPFEQNHEGSKVVIIEQNNTVVVQDARHFINEVVHKYCGKKH